ncbi:MAG: hypothetical protein M3O71_12375 [Bacteroidota bacterium]|nr:hypothetical protein [Bacteroidota bacterium]
MKSKHLFVLLIPILLCACAAKKPGQIAFNPDVYLTGTITRIDTVTFFDSSRNRPVPIAIYNLQDSRKRVDLLPQNIRKKLVILNPGYGGTRRDYVTSPISSPIMGTWLLPSSMICLQMILYQVPAIFTN